MLKKIYSSIIIGTIFLGSMTFAAVPEPALYTLSDIYNKILDGTTASAHTFPPALAPADTFKTLTEIWEAIPPFITLAENDLDSGIFPAGIYASSTDLITIEPNLLASNIASGTVMFGVVGTYVPDPCFQDIGSYSELGIEWYESDTPLQKVTWDVGVSTCLNLDTAGGYNPGVAWRLPSVEELVGLQALYGLPDFMGFIGNSSSDYYWSNYIYNNPPYPDNTKAIRMTDGRVDDGRLKTSPAYTHCVRP